MTRVFAVESSWPAGLRHVIALAACSGVTAVLYPLGDRLDHANVVMAYLLAVAIVARTFGQAPAILAAVASVLLFDFFYVDPRFSFAVADAQFVMTFGVMLVVALMIGTLTARLRNEAESATVRERRTAALYTLARDLSGALTVESVAQQVATFVRRQLDLEGALLIPDRAGRLCPVIDRSGRPLDLAVPTKVVEQGTTETFVDRHTGDVALAMPLPGRARPRGALVVLSAGGDSPAHRSDRSLLEATAALTGVVVERLHYVEVAHEATVRAKTEQLRNAILSTVSHDLRTPLTVLVGLADALADDGSGLAPRQAEAAATIREEANRMSWLVTNLLDLARLQSGRVELRKEWQPVEDVVETSVRAIEPGLARGRRIVIELPSDLPLVEFDAVLVERVVTNLLDNAARHGRGEIIVAATVRGAALEVSVSDEGDGIPAVDDAAASGALDPKGDRRRGGGIGLAICRTIVEAHGGVLRAGRSASGRAQIAFTLPLGNPPACAERPEERSAEDSGT